MEQQSKEQIPKEVSRSKVATTSFQKIIAQIEKSQWRKALGRASKIYNIKVYSLQKLTLNRVKDIYNTITEKFYVQDRTKQNWNENELRVYVWLLFAYANSLGKSPDDFYPDNWSALASCFLGKSVHLCEFQYNSLKKLSNKVVKWSEMEDELLSLILNEREIKNHWNEIAKELFLRSNKEYFRTSKQCRERWNNYLDPSKSHSVWTLEEDILLIRAVYDKGKKWALISKILQSRRTEHMVKNRFNSIMCKYLKANNRKTCSDNIPLEDFLSWLTTQNQKDTTNKNKSEHPKNSKEEGVKVQTLPEFVQGSQSAGQKLPLIPLPEKKDYCQKLTLSTPTAIPYEKSPIMLFSPVVTSYTPLVFSPYNDFGNIFIYQNQNESGDQTRIIQSPMDPNSMMGFNYFSFENLQRR